MKKTLLTACLAGWAAFASALPTPNFSSDSVGIVPRKTASSRHQSLLSFSKKYLRARYRAGGSSPRGFDCSGFTRFCFSHVGIHLPHSSGAQLHAGERINREDAQPGDLIFFRSSSRRSSRINHVGLIVEVVGNRIRFIHSAWDGVRYDWLHAGYYQTRFVGVTRIQELAN